VINAATTDPMNEIQKITAVGAPYILETSGNANVLTQAIYSSAPGGTIGIVGAPAMGTEISVDVNFMLFNRKLRGIIEGEAISDIFIPALIELYKQGKFPFDKLITFYNLEEINKAAEDSEKGVTLKPVLRVA